MVKTPTLWLRKSGLSNSIDVTGVGRSYWPLILLEWLQFGCAVDRTLHDLPSQEVRFKGTYADAILEWLGHDHIYSVQVCRAEDDDSTLAATLRRGSRTKKSLSLFLLFQNESWHFEGDSVLSMAQSVWDCKQSWHCPFKLLSRVEASAC